MSVKVYVVTDKNAIGFIMDEGIDERADIEKLPLRSSEESYIPFINAIENR